MEKMKNKYNEEGKKKMRKGAQENREKKYRKPDRDPDLKFDPKYRIMVAYTFDAAVSPASSPSTSGFYPLLPFILYFDISFMMPMEHRSTV